jgi:hypothetical protein
MFISMQLAFASTPSGRTIMMRILLAGLAATAVGLASLPASAQWGPPGGGYGGQGGYGGGPRGGYRQDFDDDEDERPRYRRRPAYGEGYGYGAPRVGAICVTSRGNCRTRPAPLNSPCGCDVPGFGFKRGAIGY